MVKVSFSNFLIIGHTAVISKLIGLNPQLFCKTELTWRQEFVPTTCLINISTKRYYCQKSGPTALLGSKQTDTHCCRNMGLTVGLVLDRTLSLTSKEIFHPILIKIPYSVAYIVRNLFNKLQNWNENFESDYPLWLQAGNFFLHANLIFIYILFRLYYFVPKFSFLRTILGPRPGAFLFIPK